MSAGFVRSRAGTVARRGVDVIGRGDLGATRPELDGLHGGRQDVPDHVIGDRTVHIGDPAGDA